MSETTSILGSSDGLWFCKEDLKHHAKHLATASSKDKGIHCPSPVEVFIAGAPNGLVSTDYLDGFPPESRWYKDIQKFKAENDLQEKNEVKA